MRLFFLLLSIFLSISNVYCQVLVKDSADIVRPGTPLVNNPVALNFLVMGDWGRNGADHQKEVADQMGKTASEMRSQFVIATGDNFYPSGVISEFDPLFKYSFEDIYTAFSLQWDWYPVLGNHDYKSKPEAQVAYTKISRRWKMPARYHALKFPINGDTTQQVLIIFLDTNPLIPEYYRGRDYRQAVRSQDSTAQKKWLAKVLSDTSSAIKWKIVVGHHPLFTGGGRTEAYDIRAMRSSLKPLFDKYGVNVYIAGHEHSLQHLAPKGKTQYFISGAASERTAVSLIPESKMAASEYGFMVFSATKDQLLVQTIDYRGNLIYKTTIQK